MTAQNMGAFLLKRQKNIKSPVKKQGPTPERVRPKKGRIDFLSDKESNDDKADQDADSSGASSILFSPASNSDDASNLNSSEAHIALVKALQALFTSSALPPKKMGCASEALLHILEPTEDPDVFLQKEVSPVRCYCSMGARASLLWAKHRLQHQIKNSLVRG